MIAIHTLTSPLHDAAAISASTSRFLSFLNIGYTLLEDEFDKWGSADLDLIFVRTGGTEGLFKEIFPKLKAASGVPIVLLASPSNNSLPASMEILSYLRSQGARGEIVHGSPSYVAERLTQLERTGKALRALSSLRLGVIGDPSDWLIASHADAAAVKARTGMEIVRIPMKELLSRIDALPLDEQGARLALGKALFDAAQNVKDAASGAYRIYRALRDVVDAYRLDGFTLRCFDLLTTVRNTGCFALAKLNSEGILAGCEGDVPALLSMAVARTVCGVSGFQANPSSIDPQTREVVFAHCTIPLDMVTRHHYDTHFESGIGVGVSGHMQEGPVTVFKVSGDLSRHHVQEGMLIRNTSRPDLCRTQIVVELPDTQYFLSEPIGNHHVILPGHVASRLEEVLR